ncbi:unnamed protein product [Ambrosiozyma monospora]|uniref:diacylglycerol O-acyltransferase n=1 Tax=Ambrosiozyma monospora TaxID=43982 RepID=A0A9W6WGZ4_AMBMO|nr:unnamed protein product [Ambrosiozyma monospora]
MIPFYRDYVKKIGFGLVTKKGIKGLLSRNMSVSIVIGGLAESKFARPGMNRLVLQRRKGFVKLALEMVGVNESGDIKPDEVDLCIVPSYSFGENSIYDVFDSKKNANDDFIAACLRLVLGTLRQFAKRYLGVKAPLIWSRGVFNYDIGMLPYRRQVDVVIGEPIPIRRLNGLKSGDPVTNEEVEYYHKVYVDAVVKLFNDNKKKYSNQYEEDLAILE